MATGSTSKLDTDSHTNVTYSSANADESFPGQAKKKPGK